MDAEERRLLQMGPMVRMMVEHTPYVAERHLSWLERLAGVDPRIVRYTNKSLPEIAKNAPEFVAMHRLTTLGYFEEVRKEPRWDIDPPMPDQRTQFELDGFRAGRYARGDYTEITWRRTEKGESLLKQLNPPPKPKFRFREISENECEIVFETPTA